MKKISFRGRRSLLDLGLIAFALSCLLGAVGCEFQIVDGVGSTGSNGSSVGGSESVAVSVGVGGSASSVATGTGGCNSSAVSAVVSVGVGGSESSAVGGSASSVAASGVGGYGSAVASAVSVGVGGSAVRDRKSTRLNSSHLKLSRMPSSA